jgi:outer membrane protein assembly factor BamB
MTDTAANDPIRREWRLVGRLAARFERAVRSGHRGVRVSLPMRRVLLLLGATLLFAGGALLASGPASASAGSIQAWPMWGFNAAHTRVGPSVGLPSQRLWYKPEMVAQFGDLVEYPPSIAGGMLFYATNGGGQGGEIVARRLSDGAEQWRYTVSGGGQFASQPAVSNGVVYVGTMGPHKGRGSAGYKPELLALQADSAQPEGTVLARYPIGHAIESSPLVVGNRLYVCSQIGRLYCFDKRPNAQGKLRQLWSRPLGAKTTSSPAYRDGRIVVATYSGRIMAFNYASGKLRWKKTLRGQFYGTPAIYGTRVVVASKSNGKLYCLNARTGTTMWSYATNQGLYASPAVWNNTIYLGSKFRCFWAIDVRSGKPKWPASKVRKKRYAGPIYGSATVLRGVVYFSALPAAGSKHAVGKESGKTYAVDGRTGKLKWSWAAGAYSPVTATSSVILVTGHHTIYAFKPRR